MSAGAIHGVSFVSKQKGRSIRYYKKYCNDPRFMGVRSWIKTGDFIGVDFCYHELSEKLDIYDNETFMASASKFYVVCTDVETGKPVYRQLTDMYKEIDYLRASASLPYFSRPAGYEKKPEKRILSTLFYRKYPEFSEVLKYRYFTYNESMKYIEQLEKQGEVLVIRPEEALNIGRLENNPEKTQEIYNIGY